MGGAPQKYVYNLNIPRYINSQDATDIAKAEKFLNLNRITK